MKQGDINTWLGIGSVAVGLVGLWWMLNNAQNSQPATALNSTTATLPTLSGGDVSAPTYTVAPTTGGSPLFPGLNLPLPNVTNITLNIPAPQIPDLSDPSTWVLLNPYGNSNTTPPWVAIPGTGGNTATSADGGCTGGSCGCGCSDGGVSSYLGNTISGLISQKQEDALIATWTEGVPNLGGNTLLAPAPLWSPSYGFSSPGPAIGVPGYNGGNSIGPA